MLEFLLGSESNNPQQLAIYSLTELTVCKRIILFVITFVDR